MLIQYRCSLPRQRAFHDARLTRAYRSGIVSRALHENFTTTANDIRFMRWYIRYVAIFKHYLKAAFSDIIFLLYLLRRKRFRFLAASLETMRRWRDYSQIGARVMHFVTLKLPFMLITTHTTSSLTAWSMILISPDYYLLKRMHARKDRYYLLSTPLLLLHSITIEDVAYFDVSIFADW